MGNKRPYKVSSREVYYILFMHLLNQLFIRMHWFHTQCREMLSLLYLGKTFSKENYQIVVSVLMLDVPEQAISKLWQIALKSIYFPIVMNTNRNMAEDFYFEVICSILM